MDHLFDSLSILLNGLLILCKKCLGSPRVWCTLDIQAGLTTEFLNHWGLTVQCQAVRPVLGCHQHQAAAQSQSSSGKMVIAWPRSQSWPSKTKMAAGRQIISSSVDLKVILYLNHFFLTFYEKCVA